MGSVHQVHYDCALRGHISYLLIGLRRQNVSHLLWKDHPPAVPAQLHTREHARTHTDALADAGRTRILVMKVAFLVPC